MNETAEVANSLPAIILLSFWWALLSMLDVLSRQRGPADRPVAGRPAGETRAAAEGFQQLREIDPEFSAEAFLDGACRAYEAVLRAYALCDVKALRPLLSAEVLQALADSCAERAQRRETLELTFVGIRSREIASVEISPEAMEIAVLFRAQVIRAERSPEGDVIRGDPAAIIATADLWTFSRPLPVEGPAWTVVATDEALEPA